MQALARVDCNSWRRGMSTLSIKRVAAGGCRRGYERGRACASVSSSSSSSPSLPTLTRSTPHSQHLARRVDQARELRRGRNHRLCSGGGTGGGVAGRPNVGIARTYASSPPAQRVVPGAAQPLHRRWTSRAPATVGGVEYSAWYGALVEGHASSFARHLCLTPGLRWPPYLARRESARPPSAVAGSREAPPPSRRVAYIV